MYRFHDKKTTLIVNPYDEDTINAVFEIEISDSECNTLVNSNNIE